MASSESEEDVSHGSSTRKVFVTRKEGFACAVDASDKLPVSPEVAFAMLTDPESYKFMSSMKVRWRAPYAWPRGARSMQQCCSVRRCILAA